MPRSVQTKRQAGQKDCLIFAMTCWMKPADRSAEKSAPEEEKEQRCDRDRLESDPNKTAHQHRDDYCRAVQVC